MGVVIFLWEIIKLRCGHDLLHDSCFKLKRYNDWVKYLVKEFLGGTLSEQEKKNMQGIYFFQLLWDTVSCIYHAEKTKQWQVRDLLACQCTVITAATGFCSPWAPFCYPKLATSSSSLWAPFPCNSRRFHRPRYCAYQSEEQVKDWPSSWATPIPLFSAPGNQQCPSPSHLSINR